MRNQVVVAGLLLSTLLFDFGSPAAPANAAPPSTIKPPLPAATNGKNILIRWAPHSKHPSFSVCRKVGAGALTQLATVAPITDPQKIEETFGKEEWPKIAQILGGHGVNQKRCESSPGCRKHFTQCGGSGPLAQSTGPQTTIPNRCTAPKAIEVPATLFHFLVNSQAPIKDTKLDNVSTVDNADLRMGLPIASWRAAIVMGYAYEDKDVFKKPDEVFTDANQVTYEVRGGTACNGEELFKPLLVKSAAQLKLLTPDTPVPNSDLTKRQLVNITDSPEITGKDPSGNPTGTGFGARSHATVFLKVNPPADLQPGQAPFGYDIQRCTKRTDCDPNDQKNDGKASGWITVNHGPIFPRLPSTSSQPLKLPELGKDLEKSLTTDANGKPLMGPIRDANGKPLMGTDGKPLLKPLSPEVLTALKSKAKAQIDKYNKVDFSFAEQATPRSEDKTGLQIGVPYLYRLAVRDLYNKRSLWSLPIEATARDRQLPIAPMNLKATLVHPGKAVSLSWDAAHDLPSMEPSSISKYRVFRNAVFNPKEPQKGWEKTPIGETGFIHNTPPATSFIDKQPPAGARLWYRIEAVDAAGNASMPSGPAFVWTPIPVLNLQSDQSWGKVRVNSLYQLTFGSVSVSCGPPKEVSFGGKSYRVCDPHKGKRPKITWQKPTATTYGAPQGYRVYRSFPPSTNWHQIAEVSTASGKLEYEDTYLPSQTTAVAYQVATFDPRRNLTYPTPANEAVLVAGKNSPATPLLKKAVLSGTDKNNDVQVALEWDVPSSAIATFSVHRMGPTPPPHWEKSVPSVLTVAEPPSKLDGMRSLAKTDKNPNDPTAKQLPAIPRLTENSLFNYGVVAHDPVTGLTSTSGTLSTAMAMSTSGALGDNDLHMPVGEIPFVQATFTSMAAAKDGNRSVFLKWQMPWAWNVGSKTFYSAGYVVFRSESPDRDFIQVSKVLPREDPQFTDNLSSGNSNPKASKLHPNTTYYYQVLALTPEGEIGWVTPIKSVATTETLAEQQIVSCPPQTPRPKFLKLVNTEVELPTEISGCTPSGKLVGSLTLPNGTKASFRDLTVENAVLMANGVSKATVKPPMPPLQWHNAHETVTLKHFEGKAGAFNASIEIELKAHPLRIKGVTEVSTKKDLKLTKVTTEFTGPMVTVAKLVAGAGPTDVPATNDGYLGEQLKIDLTVPSSEVILRDTGLSANLIRTASAASVFLPAFPAALRGVGNGATPDARMVAYARGIKVALKSSRIDSGNVEHGELRMELAVGCGGVAKNQFLQAVGSFSISPGTGALWGDVAVRRVVSLDNPAAIPVTEREISWSAFALKWKEAQKAILYIPGGTTRTADVAKHMLAHMQPSTGLPNQLLPGGSKGLDAGLNFNQLVGQKLWEISVILPGLTKQLAPEVVDLYLRPSGVGGLLRSPGFPEYSLHGFQTTFLRVGGSFLQNVLASEIKANVRVPHPRDKSQKGAEFVVEGWELNCACLGNGPTKKTLTPLPYWGVKLTPATLAFGDGQSCPAPDEPLLVVTAQVDVESESNKGDRVRRLKDPFSADIGFQSNGHIAESKINGVAPQTLLYVGLGNNKNPSTDYWFKYHPTELKFSDPDKPICQQDWAMSGCESTFEPEVFCSKDTAFKESKVIGISLGKLPTYNYKCENKADKNKAGQLDNNKAGVVGITGEITFPWFGAVPTTALIVPAAGGLKKDYVFFDKPIPISREFTDGGGKKFAYEVSYLPAAASHPPQFVDTGTATIAGMPDIDSTVVIAARKGKGPTALVALDGASLVALTWSVGAKIKKWGGVDDESIGAGADKAANCVSDLPKCLGTGLANSTNDNTKRLAGFLKGTGTFVGGVLKYTGAQYLLEGLTFATVEELYGYGVVSEEEADGGGDSLDGLGGKLTLSVKNVFDKGYASFSGKKDGSFSLGFSMGANDKDDPAEGVDDDGNPKKGKFRVFGTKVSSADFQLEVDTQAESVDGSLNLKGLSLPPIPDTFKGTPDPNRLIVTELGGMLGVGNNPSKAYVGASVGLTVQGYSVSGRFLVGGNIPATFALNSGILDPDAKALLDEALLSEGQITDATLTGLYTGAGMGFPMPFSPMECPILGSSLPALYKAVFGADGAFWILGSSGGHTNIGARLYGHVEAEAACILTAKGGLGFAVNAGKEFLMRGTANIALGIFLFLGTWDLGASVAATFPASGDVKVQDTSATSEWTWAWD